MPEKNSVAVTGNPVIVGTRNVAPNIATTCWAPSPMVRGHVSRSPGRTISPSRMVLPSWWSVQFRAMPGFCRTPRRRRQHPGSTRRQHRWSSGCRASPPLTARTTTPAPPLVE